ncbi:MAG: ABC transporter ATP-binding protein [Anaerolineae bacterium]|nr:ABC transporter ATP-binding protein [Anaerolineae bacterium]MDW8100681.1 ABC transporter ATP-binding protein [Anaerolineae bacterium]
MSVAVRLEKVSKLFTLNSQQPYSLQEAVIAALTRTRPQRTESFWALRDVSFDVQAGESLAVIGANGAGKSTLLKLIARILVPTSGYIAVHGRVAALLELGAGFHPDLTGRENIALNGSILGLNRRFIRRQMDEIVAFAGLEHFIDMPVRNYSSGMLMRLGFAVATAFQPEILLIDEVLAVGDQVFQDRCLRRIREIQEKGATVILVSHDLESARRLCRRAIWLDEGHVRADGPTDAIIAQYLEAAWTLEQSKAVAEPAQLVEIAQETSGDGSLSLVCQASDDAPSRTARWGSGEIRIEKAEILDACGLSRRVFRTGETFVVRMWYRADRPISAPAFGVSLYNEDGVRINGPNTVWSGAPIDRVQGRGCVDYIVDALPLLPGRYELTVAVYDATVTHPYDHWHRMDSFVVTSSDFERQDGMVFIPCRWVHREEEA